ncbi:MAG: hypothetical protein O2931_00295 [Planctomycetota bacterium]|nr:hypothetical protein [Planctomycetota bacterium]MDA1177213.1 hypothetical protein [Planctomycetota bacterium]
MMPLARITQPLHSILPTKPLQVIRSSIGHTIVGSPRTGQPLVIWRSYDRIAWGGLEIDTHAI